MHLSVRAIHLTQEQKVIIQSALPQGWSLIAPQQIHRLPVVQSKESLPEGTPVKRKRGRPELPKNRRLRMERKSMRLNLSQDFSASSDKEEEERSEIKPLKSWKSEFSEKVEPSQNSSDMHFVISMDSIGKSDAGKGKGKEVNRPKTPEKKDQNIEIGQSQKQKTGQGPLSLAKEPSEQPAALIEGLSLKKEIEDFQREKMPEQREEDVPEESSLPNRFEVQWRVLQKLKKHRLAVPFLKPVDEEVDGAPDYYKEITNPIDLQTIEFKLVSGIYNSPLEFQEDVGRLWSNSRHYNEQKSKMWRLTSELERYYYRTWEKLHKGVQP